MNMEKQYYLLTIFDKSSHLYNGFEEIIRERVYIYKKSSTPLDFWVLKNIKYNKNLSLSKQLEAQKTDFPEDLTNLSKGFSIITTNKTFFLWMKLRYGYFENMAEIINLDTIQKPQYTIDGIFLNLDKISCVQPKSNLFKL